MSRPGDFEGTRWLHRNSSEDEDFADRLLQNARAHFSQQPPITKYQLADILTAIGVDLRDRARDRAGDNEGLLWNAQRLIDLGGYLNATQEGDDPEPSAPPAPLWRRLWWRLHGRGIGPARY